MTSTLLTASAVGALTLGAAACTSDGTDEPGDDPVEDVGDPIEDVGDGLNEGIDDLEDGGDEGVTVDE